MNIELTIDNIKYLVTAIVPPPPPPPPISATGLLLVPFDAPAVVTKLDALTSWLGEHDTYTGGAATGATAYPVAFGGKTARSFFVNYTNHGGFRFHAVYDTDVNATHFVYAGNLWFDAEAPAQMELDNNQVIAKKTIIYGVQCNANSGAWDVTIQDPKCRWIPTAAKSSPKLWPTKKWLHFEIAAHRDSLGNVTYDDVHLDGVTQHMGVTLSSAQAMGWTPEGVLLVNFQVNGASAGSGTIKVYAYDLQMAKW